MKPSVPKNNVPKARQAGKAPSRPRADQGNLWNTAMETAARGLGVSPSEISGLASLKMGMTNRSFLFSSHGKRYILRLPGEGTDQLIDRQTEAEAYQAIQGLPISDRLVWIDAESGVKISEFEETARPCNPHNRSEVSRCMAFLRGFHDLGLRVSREFDLFGKIRFYESLRGRRPSRFPDYRQTKASIFALRPFVEAHRRPSVLAHIDSVPDNFLFVRREEGERILLIDWEYAAMQDPDIDVAMFAIYALYNRTQIESLIDMYYPEGHTAAIHAKILAYVAVCGLLWSNWCEFKHLHGVEFGEYALRQYQYAREYAAEAQAFFRGGKTVFPRSPKTSARPNPKRKSP
jgi:thiamine kinase-like enzyme